MTEFRMRVDTESVNEAGNNLARALNDWLTRYGPDTLFRTCASCRHMTEGNLPAHCAKYNMTPPARVILSGCPSHDDKESVPF